jgi:ElaB/YqjD/DUF883 family membrane-anchored ribosome-binding protein
METAERVAKSTNATVENVSDNLHHAVDTVAKVASKAADTLGEKGGQLADSQQKVLDECSGFVRANPLTSVLIAAGVGYIFSKLSN